jgi:mannose-1-phosphate guanylyltransferase
MESSVLDRIPEGVEYSAERALFPGLVEEGARLFAMATDAYWMDIGTPAKYLQANLDALSGAFSTDAVASPGEASVVAGEGVSIGDGCKLSSVCLGPGSRVENGAVVERSVLLPDAVVGRGSRVVNSILGKGVRIEAGVSVEGETLADETRVGG